MDGTESNVEGSGEQKKGKILGVLRGGQSNIRGRRRGPRARSRRELELDRRLRERFAAITDQRGNVPGKPFYRIREGEQHPWRTWARLVVFAEAAGLSLDGKQQMHAAIREFAEWSADVLFGQSQVVEVPRDRAA